MNKTRIKISLRIRHPTLHWEAIADILKIHPSTSWNRGDIRNTPSGGERTETYCCFPLLEGDFYVDDAVLCQLDYVSQFRVTRKGQSTYS